MEVTKILKEKGVVGAGGAGFPTYAKLKKEGILSYIVNGIECEPLLWVTKEILKRFPEKVAMGLAALKNYTNSKEAFIAVKSKYKHLFGNLEEFIQSENLDIRIFYAGDFYPAGDEQILVYEITGKVVPPGGIPLMVGAVVNNVETVYNVYNALFEGKPVTEKFITVSGDIEKPVTVKVPIGMKISSILEQFEIEYEKKVIIDGGPIMGKIISKDDVITKTSGGILVFEKKHPVVSKKMTPIEQILRKARTCCIQCRYCTDQCPRYLLGHEIEPHKIMISLAFNLEEKFLKSALICSECGVCEMYSCPQGLSPRRVNQYLKGLFAKKGVKYSAEKKEYSARQNRDLRKIPTSRLLTRMSLDKYEKEPEFIDEKLKTDEVKIYTKQHIGAKAIPVVQRGDKVNEGDVLAKIEENLLGADIHASIPGIVTDVTEDFVIIKREEKL
ncbi:MAG: respiratory-chain NADH dehydrogenase domain 51 kDa subunit [Thermoanaerobacter thermocopriae]|nr:MAG: respiratory-chain NADH dehydrogenase domain 51 kDa subunit [Thermoanaerobacter thermocopriae]